MHHHIKSSENKTRHEDCSQSPHPFVDSKSQQSISMIFERLWRLSQDNVVDQNRHPPVPTHYTHNGQRQKNEGIIQMACRTTICKIHSSAFDPSKINCEGAAKYRVGVTFKRPLVLSAYSEESFMHNPGTTLIVFIF